MGVNWRNRRVVPTLLIEEGRVVKTRRFRGRPRYVGDLLNILRVFNDKQVDEVVIVDRGAARHGIDFPLLQAAAAEFFAPITYGGGIGRVEDAVRATSIGIEKVLLTSHAPDEGLLAQTSASLGAQSVVAGLDVVRTMRGERRCAVDGARRALDGSVVDWARRYVEHGAGELFLNATWREGMRIGYELGLLEEVCASVTVPVTVCGGAGAPADFERAFRAGASAAAAGTMFVFFGPFEAVLPTYVGIEGSGAR